MAEAAMNWKHLVLIVAGLGMILLAGTIVLSSPLLKSQAAIRTWLLTETPIGSSSNAVRAVLDRHRWYSQTYQQLKPSPAADPFLAGELGSYWLPPWSSEVIGFWEFDKSNRLADIRVHKMRR